MDSDHSIFLHLASVHLRQTLAQRLASVAFLAGTNFALTTSFMQLAFEQTWFKKKMFRHCIYIKIECNHLQTKCVDKQQFYKVVLNPRSNVLYIFIYYLYISQSVKHRLILACEWLSLSKMPLSYHCTMYRRYFG